MDTSGNLTPAWSRSLLVGVIVLLAAATMTMMSACGPSDEGQSDAEEVDAGDGGGGKTDAGDTDGGDADGGDADGGDEDGGDEDGGDGDGGGEQLPPGTCGQEAGECEDPDEYCAFPIDSVCGSIGYGKCEPRVADCGSLPDEPVCGCDRQTYRNVCEANLANVLAHYEGACEDPLCRAQDAKAEGVDCADLKEFGFAWNGTACLEVYGCKCVGVDCGDTFPTEAECLDTHEANGCVAPIACDANAACPGSKPFCRFPTDDACGATSEGTCVAKSVCQPVFPCVDPELEAGHPDCVPRTSNNERVCGCDGTTYDAECSALEAGVNVAYRGPCAVTECRAQTSADWGGQGQRWDGEKCVGATWRECDDEEWRWDPAERERCQQLPATLAECIGKYEALGCWTPPACGGNTGKRCGYGFYCVYESADACGLSGAGTCQLMPTSCENEPDERVCGCDEIRYENACEAQIRGVNVKNVGLCPSVCAPAPVKNTGDPSVVKYAWDGTACAEVPGCEGARCYLLKQDCLDETVVLECTEPIPCAEGNNDCPADSFCSYEADNECGSAGKPGGCKVGPKATDWCGEDDVPVCGCDGVDYDTACDAQKARTDTKKAMGRCL